MPVITTTKTSALAGWRLAAIGAVGALAVGAGVVAGTFLLSSRVALGAGAAYVPEDVAFYFEARIQPSAAQDAALRDFLGQFPPIEGLDLDRPLADQVAERADELLTSEDTDLSWEADVAPWFDGHVAVAVTDIPMDAMATTDVPSTVVLLGVSDRAAAESTFERLRGLADAPTFTTTEHAGTTIHIAEGSGMGAYAITADQVILGTDQAAIQTSLDARANASSSLATADDTARLAAALPSDWLGFAAWDMTDLVSQAFDEAAGVGGAELTDSMRSLMENQPLRGAMAVSAAGDRIAMDLATDPPSGPFAAENADRGLADEVPGDVLYYADAGNVGRALAAFVASMKEAAAEAPGGEEQLDMIEAALGADVEELVSWIGDAAFAAGMAGDAPYGGILAVPDDMDAAERRIDQLLSFASLAALDPTSGISVSTSDVAGVTVTSIELGGMAATPELPIPATALSVQLAVTDDRVLIGVGDGFVGSVLNLAGGSSLADQSRFTDAVTELGGSQNAGITWVDIAGLVDAVSTFMGPMMPMPAEADDWLGPLDAFVSVSRLDGSVFIQRSALLTE